MIVWFAETFIATTLLMALVMLLRRPVAHWLGAGVAYWLWALPVARMVLPVLPSQVAASSPLHIATQQAGLPVLLAATPLDNAPVQAGWAMPWLEMGVMVWVTGFGLFVAVQVIGYARFRRHILADATPLGREGRIQLIASPGAGGPMAFGVLWPYIALPADFDRRYDAQERDMAIAHEREHHAHGDLAANMIALLLLAIHWCNPIAWLAYRAYRADQETACDARVLAHYGQDQAHIYGRAILKAAGARQFAGACHLTRLATLKGRLKMLSNHETSLKRINWGMGAVALVIATGLALTASGSRAVEQMAVITDKVDRVDFGKLSNLISQPAQAHAGSAHDMAALGDVAVPQPPEPQAAPHISPAPVVPPVPARPAPPAADMISPVPPMPPIPPVSVRSEPGKIVVTHANGRVETHRIPTEAEIARMVPVVDVREGCEGKGLTSHRETVDANGRRHIRVRICNTAIEAQARHAARMGKVSARSGLVAARASIAAARMPADARAEALRDIDEEIAGLDGQID